MAAQGQPAPRQSEESVIVPGFKSSLQRALDAKRDAAMVSDSIEAEDIAKFPDLNLSESTSPLSISPESGWATRCSTAMSLSAKALR